MAKVIFKFQGPDGKQIEIQTSHKSYVVKRFDKDGFFTRNIDSFSFGRLSHAITKYYDMIGEYIEQQYEKNQSGGN